MSSFVPISICVNNTIPSSDVVGQFGSAWLSWLATAGVVLFVLLAALSIVLLLFANSRIARRFRSLIPTLRGRVTVGFLLVSTLPMISLGVVLTERDANARLGNIARGLSSDTAEVANEIAHLLDKNLSSIISLASHIQTRADKSKDALQLWLRAHHSTNFDFLTMLAANRHGEIVVATSRIGGSLETFPNVVEGVKDREYFREPMTTGMPFVSDVFQGRGLGKDIIVAISAPVPSVAGNEMWGIVEGSLNLGLMAKLDTERGFPSSLVVLDEQNRVIYASPDSGLEVLRPLDGHPLLTAARGQTPGRPFVYEPFDGNGQRVGKYIVSREPVDNGWQVFMLAPVNAVEAAVFTELGVTTAWLTAAIMVAIWLAIAFANSATRPLKRLENSLDEIKINVGTSLPTISETAPGEIKLVYKKIGAALSSLQSNNQQLLASLEQTEKLRGELTETLNTRNQEIERQTRELREANMTLHLLNRTDSLTGLANRQGFQEFLSQVWGLAVREHNPVTIICLDIDHFKAYNDRYGHPAGDRALRKVAGAINEGAGRPLDHVARNGGEEFVAVLGDTPLAAGLKVAERMRESVADLNIPHEGADGEKRVTISLGVATLVPNRKTKPISLVETADQALYKAKNEGRNRVAYEEKELMQIYQPAAVFNQQAAKELTEASNRPPRSKDDKVVNLLMPDK